MTRRMQRSAPPRDRRGTALLLVLILTSAMAALALSAITLAGNTAILDSFYNRERDLRFSADAALAMGKSRLNNDPYALPDTGYASLISNQSLMDANGGTIPGIKVSVFAGQTGSTTGQFGRFASVVAVATDPSGAKMVRRLELAQESFAKFAYWSNKESNGASTILFNSGDNLWGPVFSNDVITIGSGGATFHDDVKTAATVSGVNYGTFVKGYSEHEDPITLPSNTDLAKLPGYAAAGGFSFNAPNNGSENAVEMRIEFVAIDLNADGVATGPDEGFFRVYVANPGNHSYLRGDWQTQVNKSDNCGDTHSAVPGGPKVFFPASMHNTAWFKALMVAGGMTNAQANAEQGATLATIMGHANARCYIGGDPNLIAIERQANGWNNSGHVGGTSNTFTAAGDQGSYLQWTGTIDPRLVGRPDAAYLFPLYRGVNPGTKGVIYVNGTVGISGVLRGRVTLYSTANVVILDDLKYATDPASALANCADMLGIIAKKDVVVADNAVLTPQSVGGAFKNLDDTKDLDLQAVIMATGSSFRVENYNGGPTDANDCGTTNWGRGCLFLTGGLIQDSRGAVGTSGGTGFIKRYSYDRCAAVNPPPYFPTTGRFLDNRYYELDPARFNVANLFHGLTPN